MAATATTHSAAADVRVYFLQSIEHHCWYQIGTGSPKLRRPILLDRSDLILVGLFDP